MVIATRAAFDLKVLSSSKAVDVPPRAQTDLATIAEILSAMLPKAADHAASTTHGNFMPGCYTRHRVEWDECSVAARLLSNLAPRAFVSKLLTSNGPGLSEKLSCAGLPLCVKTAMSIISPRFGTGHAVRISGAPVQFCATISRTSLKI